MLKDSKQRIIGRRHLGPFILTAEMKERENMLVKYGMKNYYFLYLELSNVLRDIETTTII